MLPKCSVLLIEDSPDSAMLVNHFLASSKIAEFHVVTAGSLQAARDALGRERFDAVLVDLNLPDSRGIETFARVREGARESAIVILTGVEEEAVATMAISQGAADYLIKGEVGGEGLARRIRFAVERARTAPAPEVATRGRVTVFVGAKGGAGVSTTALNVAAALSRRERNTVLLELHPSGGSLAVILNIISPLTLDMMAELGGSNKLESTSGKLPFGTRLVAAPTGPETTVGWETAKIEALVEKAAMSAAHVIIDSTTTQPDLKAVMARATFTALVLEREPVSQALAARMIPTLASWAGRPNRVGAVLINVPFIDSPPLTATRAELNCGIVAVLPPARELLHSYRRMGPIVIAQPDSPIARALDDLAGRLDQDPVQFMV